MSILNKYKRWKHPILLMLDKYWDFVLSLDGSTGIDLDGSLTDRCLISYVDFTDRLNCYDNRTYHSTYDYMWDGAVNDGAELNDIGFTAIDNGLALYDKNTILNSQFYNLLVTSNLTIDSGDTRFHLIGVSGNTQQYSYDLCYNPENDYISFLGGFLQGFYKLFNFDYEVLPQRIDDAMHFEFVIRPQDYITKNNTLNNSYPENRGTFFYIGTRSENKFAHMYGADLSSYPDRETGSTINDCSNYFMDDYFSNIDVCGEKEEEEIDQNDVNLECTPVEDSEGLGLTDDVPLTFKSNNKYLLFNRTRTGYTVFDWERDDLEEADFELTYDKPIINDNMYLFMNNTRTGHTVHDVFKYVKGSISAYTEYYINKGKSDSQLEKEAEEEATYYKKDAAYDIISDIQNNAFALKINGDGSIGYKYLVKDCDSSTGYSIIEQNTYPNMVNMGEWSVINVKFKIMNGTLDKCGNPIGKRKMKIFIYVNGYLKLVSKELDEFNFRELADKYTRQELVPFNISLGGGTQGMADSVWIKYKEMFPKVLPLEQNFAGSFIGDMRSFKIYNCELQYNEIKNNYLYEINRIKNGK